MSAALAVVAPALGQEEVGVEQRLEPAATHSQMHRHDAVLLLAQRPAILSLNSRSLVPLLRDGGLVNQPDRPPIVRLDRLARLVQLGRLGQLRRCRQPLLIKIAHPPLIPNRSSQEPLQRSNRRPALQRDRLDRLPRQVRQQAATVRPKVLQDRTRRKTLGKQFQIPRQQPTQRHQLLHRHRTPPCVT